MIKIIKVCTRNIYTSTYRGSLNLACIRVFSQFSHVIVGTHHKQKQFYVDIGLPVSLTVIQINEGSDSGGNCIIVYTSLEKLRGVGG